jgi:aspartokinase-like uncharacterized kinase
LLELHDLSHRLRAFFQSLRTSQLILVVGGGRAADVVRDRDRLEQLGEEKSHWLAVRAMSFNGYLIEALLEDTTVVSSIAQCQAAWASTRLPILDAHSFLVADAFAESPLPHSWSVTSDSIAARVASASGADELILLKSVSWPVGHDMKGAAEQHVVDEHLPIELMRSPGLRVRVENLRCPPSVPESLDCRSIRGMQR